MHTLIQNYQKHTTVTKLKETYSLLYQAIKLSEVDNGAISNWNFGKDGCRGASEFSEKYIAPYLKIIKKCICDDTNECKMSAGSLNDHNYTFHMDYYSSRSEKIFLSNGSLVVISRPPDNGNPHFFVDINGKNKPNILGKDVFGYEFVNGHLIPRGGDISRDDLKIHQFGCNKNGSGSYCSRLIMLDNWTISKDYPW